ncbi:hypothetical protein BS50DRAFT_492701 [Corynespora cassiicola Philippines]|uniref:BAG domain-containing protein n=1 Tax=Corynespora cassiicola Philippines TaxID=1448308 RepID=A0A2T2NRF8_CORCC|nr:hypothetical protein BS50DRAFT_492701 [Corynespora cassiicola Philippines]
MARRSARLQKSSTTPESSNNSFDTAQSHSSTQNERLPSVIEGQEPAMKTPQKSSTTKIVPESRLPPPSNTATPLKDKSSKSLLMAITARTPKNRTPIKPAGQEMHPAQFHASTAKVLDEARWLGFQAMGANTAPPKASGFAAGQETPTKTPAPEVSTPSSKLAKFAASPEFKFRFKSPIGDLSPNTNNILNGPDNEEDVVGGHALFGADEFTTPKDVSSKRKTVKPKGKMARFSDVHMAQFKKMDSIANHPSAFRADPNRFKPVGASSKTDLDQPESSTNASNRLKRTQSKMDVTTAPVTKTVPTPLKRTQSKKDVAEAGSSATRAQSTVKMVPPRDGQAQSQDGNPTAKRIKRTEADDVASTRPASRDNKYEPAAPATPARKITSQTALPRLTSRLMTPTKSSLARAHTVKATKSASMLPALVRSPSTNNIFSPSNIGQVVRDGVREGIRKTSSQLQRVRSILRTPSRKYSDDPEKVASGTHMSPPPGLDLLAELPKVPATAPIKKHVNFTSSTLERAAQDELGKSPSPMKLRAGSEVPTGAVIYPTLQPGVEYPELPKADESPVGSPSRRLTFGGATANTPTKFSFKSDKSISFGPSSAGTIRMVRSSDASSAADGKKRKLDTVEEASDKENNQPPVQDVRSAKKMKPTPAEPPKTPVSTSKLSRRTPKRPSTISKLLANFLQEHSITDLPSFLSHPRFDDPAYLTALAIVLAAVFTIMSWFSRSGGSSWGGRFSPFGRPSNSPNAGEVSDSDFSYITSEDLKEATKGRRPEVVDWDDKNPDRDTDVLVFKKDRTNYPVHFPAHSIRDGDLKIGTVRQAAAKKIGVNDPRRIRMFFKGRNLKHDERMAREEGLRGDGTGSEILCVVGDASSGSMAPGSEDAQRAWSDGENEDDDTDSGVDSAANNTSKKKPRKRGGKKNKKRGGAAGNNSGTSTPGYSSATPAGSEFLPIPSHIPAPRPTSAPPANTPRAAAAPQTPIQKLDAIASKFHTELVPLCVTFMNNPPAEKDKRTFEHKKLTETIMGQILLKLDGVESEGDPNVRTRRKEVVKEVQAMLRQLDEANH